MECTPSPSIRLPNIHVWTKTYWKSQAIVVCLLKATALKLSKDSTHIIVEGSREKIGLAGDSLELLTLYFQRLEKRNVYLLLL